MSAREFNERDLNLALDGEMADDERRDFERWLEGDAETAARGRRYAADRDLLRAALDPVLDEPLPGRLVKLVSGGAASPPRSAQWSRRAAAAVLLVALGAAAGFAVRALLPGGASTTAAEAQLPEEALAAHRIYAAEKLHVVEVGADQEDHLVKWLSNRLGTRLVAPDLSASGFSLVGGRLLPAADGVAAQFMYQDPTGNRVSLYVTTDTNDPQTGFRLFEHAGARAFYWVDEGYGCAVAGAVPEPTLLAIADAAYKQLLASYSGHSG